MTTLTEQEVIKSFFDALKDALESGENWPSGTGFAVYRYENMRDYTAAPPRPFIFLGTRAVGDEPTWRPCLIMNTTTRKISVEMGSKSILLSVALQVIGRNGSEDSAISRVLRDVLDTVTFSNSDGSLQFAVDTEEGWDEEPGELPAAMAMEGSLRYWLTLSANYIIM